MVHFMSVIRIIRLRLFDLGFTHIRSDNRGSSVVDRVVG